MKTKGEAMDNKNKFAAETVRQLQESLDEVAPYQVTELSKQQAIRALSPQILSLRSKGYSWTAIAAMLSERGVPVSVAALRTYLRRVREEDANEAPRTTAKRLRDGRAVAHPPEPPRVMPPPQTREGMPPSQTREGSAANKPQQAAAAPASAIKAQHVASAAPGRKQEPSRSTFGGRPDTDDI
jgi:hypothetical protein